MRGDRPGRRITALFLAGLLSTWTMGFPCRELLSENEASGDSRLSLAKAGKDIKDVLVSPFHWKQTDFLKLSAVLGTGFLLGLADENIRTWAQERRTPGSDDFFGFVTNLGDGGYLCGFMAGLVRGGGGGREQQPPEDRPPGLREFSGLECFYGDPQGHSRPGASLRRGGEPQLSSLLKPFGLHGAAFRAFLGGLVCGHGHRRPDGQRHRRRGLLQPCGADLFIPDP